ncbi:amidohydrolase family protein, partial [Vibrio parahaemolyticus]|uniref:amidohydrolase family protein n=1 Tax=Vibrio parahaemolyticus TaxID=670 RepID=UPI001A8FBB05
PGLSSLEYLEKTGVLAARPLLIHCVNVNRAEIDKAGAYGASIAHCPKSNAKLGHGVAPLEDFLDSGIAVGLGSDSVASNNLCDLIEEARF